MGLDQNEQVAISYSHVTCCSHKYGPLSYDAEDHHGSNFICQCYHCYVIILTIAVVDTW